MKNIRLSNPVILPKGTVCRIDPAAHFQSVRTLEDLDALTAILYETESASRAYARLIRIGAPDIIQYKSYQKLQNIVWKLYDRFPADIPRS